MKWIAPHGAATSTERYRNAQPTIAGSNPDAAFFNTVLDELLAVIVAADMTPTDANLHQIADAIEYLTERAATSGVTKGSYWFGKTTANFTVPNPTLPEQNYIDFTTLKTYSAKSDLSGWTQTGTFVPPVGIDFTILITSKFWDIPEQDNQQGGWAQYNHTDDEWSWWPKIIEMPAGRNVGDIFYTMRNDNELNGAVECDGATYNTTDFRGAQSIGNLLAAGKIDYISLTDYETEISTKGWCDKIGWNGTGNTQFRVPTLNAYIWQKLQTGVVGDGTPLGFNYNGNKAIINAHDESLGNNRGWVKARVNGSDTSVGNLAVSTDATQSGLLAGISTDISQQRVMIQLATDTTDEAFETCTGVLADVAALKYDYVVDFQAPTASNNYTWYRKYRSGWVEQGGIYDNGSLAESVETTITMPVVMSNNMYSATATASVDTGSSSYIAGSTVIFTHSTTQLGIVFYRLSSGCKTRYLNWQVSGMSAN